MVALHPTDLAIEAGEFVVVVGPSGCGKSTLLRLIAGLDTPSAGRVAIGGVDVTDRAPGERGVAMVFQSYALYPHLSVFENIAFPLRIAKRPKAEIARGWPRWRTCSTEILHVARSPAARATCRAGSGSGYRSAARSSASLRCFLFDEPLSNLDAELRVRYAPRVRAAAPAAQARR